MTTGFRKTLLIALIALLIVGTVATVKYLSGRAAAGRFILSGTIEADEIHVGSRVGGRIGAVLVKEGQFIKAGEPLVRFEIYDLDARRADAAAAVRQAEANLEKAVNGSRPEEIAQARAQEAAARSNVQLARNGPRTQEVDAARSELAAATADFEIARTSVARIEQLSRDGIVSQQDYDNAKATFDRAVARRETAKQRLELLLAGTRGEEIERAEKQLQQAVANRELVERGPRREDVEAARAQRDRARATLQQTETQIAELEVRALADSYVEVLQVRPGDVIGAGATVATLVEVDRLWVRVYVPEPELGRVHLGDEVSITVDTFGSESFRGRIEQIASRGEFTPRNVQTREERTHQVFALRIRIEDDTRRLRAGMAADVEIRK